MIDSSVKFSILDSTVNRYSHTATLTYDIRLNKLYISNGDESNEVDESVGYKNIYAVSSTTGANKYPSDDDITRETVYDSKNSSIRYKTSIFINTGFPDHLVVLDENENILFSQYLVGTPLHNMFLNVEQYTGIKLNNETISFDLLFQNGSINPVSVYNNTTNAEDSIDDIVINGTQQFNASHTNIFNIEVVIPLDIDTGTFNEQAIKVILCDVVKSRDNSIGHYHINVDGALTNDKEANVIMSNLNRYLLPIKRIVQSSSSQVKIDINDVMKDLSIGSTMYIMLNGQILAYAVCDDLPNYDSHTPGTSSYYYFHPSGSPQQLLSSISDALQYSQVVPFSYYIHNDYLYIESPTGGAMSNSIRFIYANVINKRFHGANNMNGMKYVIDKSHINEIDGRYYLYAGSYISKFSILDNIYDKEFDFDDSFIEFSDIENTAVISLPLPPVIVNNDYLVVGDNVDQSKYWIDSPHVSIDRSTSIIDRSNESFILNSASYIDNLTEPIEFYVYDQETGDINGMIDVTDNPNNDGVVRIPKHLYDNSNIGIFEGLRMYDTGYFNDGSIEDKLYNVDIITNEIVTLYTAENSTGVHKDGYHINTSSQIFSPNGSTPMRSGVSINPAAYSHEWFDYSLVDCRDPLVISNIDTSIINEDGEFIYRGWKGKVDESYSGWGICFVFNLVYNDSICESEIYTFEDKKIIAHLINVHEDMFPMVISKDYMYWMNSITHYTNSQSTIFGVEYTSPMFSLLGTSSTIHAVPIGKCSVYGDKMIFNRQVRNIISLSTEIDESSVLVGFSNDSLYITTINNGSSWIDSDSTITTINDDGSIEVSSIGIVVMSNSVVNLQSSVSHLYNQTNNFNDVNWIIVSSFDNSLGELSKTISFSNISTIFPTVRVIEPDSIISGTYKRHSWTYRLNPYKLNSMGYKYYVDVWSEKDMSWEDANLWWSDDDYEIRYVNTEHSIPYTIVDVNPKTMFIHCKEDMIITNENDRPYIEKDTIFSSINHERLVRSDYVIESLVFVTNDINTDFVGTFSDAINVVGSRVNHIDEVGSEDIIVIDTNSNVTSVLITLKLI